jgi:uncharacterized protein (TIGR00369 family)
MTIKKKKSAAGHAPALLNQALGSRVNRCFGCGPANSYGLKLRFRLDHETNTTIARVKLTSRYEGPPGHIHGGILATLLDEAMGKVNKLFDTVSMTRHMEIEYLRPSPLNQTHTVIGRFVRRDGRKMFMEGEVRNEAGEVLVRSKGLFIIIDPVALFARQTRHRIDGACPVAVPDKRRPTHKQA